MIYVRWFPGDYLRDTTHLSLLEDGAYRRLLDLYYTQGHALTTDRKRLYRQLRIHSPEEMGAVESVLSQYFYERRGNLFNKRASKEIQKATEISRIRSKARKDGLKRRSIDHQLMDTSSTLPKPYPKPYPKPDKEREEEEREHSSAAYVERIFSPFLTDLGISLSLFLAYKRMREVIHRPIVPGSEEHIFAELTRLKSEGGDPTEILSFAVRSSSYKLTLPPSPNGNLKGESKHEAQQRRNQEAAQRVLSKSRNPERS